MTAHYVAHVGCDRCGALAVGDTNATADHVRQRLHRAGWATYRIGEGMRDYCPRCAEQIEKENREHRR